MTNSGSGWHIFQHVSVTTDCDDDAVLVHGRSPGYSGCWHILLCPEEGVIPKYASTI